MPSSTSSSRASRRRATAAAAGAGWPRSPRHRPGRRVAPFQVELVTGEGGDGRRASPVRGAADLTPHRSRGGRVAPTGPRASRGERPRRSGGVERPEQVGDEVVGVLDPTDRRTSPAGTSRLEPATDPWVITAGTSIRDSTPPSDSASVKMDVDPATRRARSAAGARHARPGRRGPSRPPSRIWRAARAACGCACRPVRSPGIADERRRRRARRVLRPPVARCRSGWSSAGGAFARPRSTRKQSKGPGTAPIAFWRNRRRSARSSRSVASTPLTVSEWPPRYFVAEW